MRSLLGFALMALVAVPPAVLAQEVVLRPADTLAEIVAANGDEEAQLLELSDWIDVQETQRLLAGDVLRTGPYGGMAVAFDDRTQIRLHAESRMVVRDPGSERRTTRFRLDFGRVWSRATSPSREIEFETPAAVAAIRGTDWYLEVTPDGVTRLTVLDGSVSFFNEFGALEVTAGEVAAARPGEAPRREAVIETRDRPRWVLLLEGEWLTGAPVPTTLSLGETALAEALRTGGPSQALSSLDALAPTRDLTEIAARRVTRARLLAERREYDAARRALVFDRSLAEPEDRFLAAWLTVGLAIEAGALEDADRALSQLESTTPNRAEPALMRAWLEASAGRYEAAERAIEAALAARPDWSRVRVAQAQLALLSGNDEALGAITAAAVEADPNDPLAHRWRAISLLTAEGDALGAEAAFAEAVRVAPGSARDWAGLGALRSLLGDQLGAQENFARARRLDPTSARILAGAALVESARERPDLADRLLADAQALDPADPEVRFASAVSALQNGEPGSASRLAGAALAADPSRPGSMAFTAAARWAEGDREAGYEAAEAAVRLDPNDPNAALIASVMAQDLFLGGETIRYARQAWDARERSRAAGFADLPAALSGRINIGAAYSNFGMPGWGEHFGHLAASPYDANSAFFLSNVYPSPFARASGVTQGLLLDPLAVSFPLRYAEFYRAPRAEARIGGAVEGGEGGPRYSVSAGALGLVRATHPSSWAVAGDYARDAGDRANADAETALVSARFGHERNRRHGFLARLTGEWRDIGLPGETAAGDGDDRETFAALVGDFGYAFRETLEDQWFLRATGGVSRLTFDNASAFGATLDPFSYSLADGFGLEAARGFQARGLFDSGFGEPTAPILVVEPPPGGPVAGPVGAALATAIVDEDTTFSERRNADLLTLQARRAVDWRSLSLSFGFEAAVNNGRNDITVIAPRFIGPGFLLDPPAGTITEFDFIAPQSVALRQTTQSTLLEAHVAATWRASRALTLEAAVFPRRLRTTNEIALLGVDSDETESVVDARVAAALRLPFGRLRAAYQRDRTTPAIDTLAPLGGVGLTANRTLGVEADVIESLRIRLEAELSERAFVFVDAERQEIDGARAPLPGARASVAAYQANDARLDTVAAGVEAQLSERVAVALQARRTWTENRDPGLQNGAPLPFAARDEVSATFSYLHPANVRASVSVTHAAGRTGDLLGAESLEDATVVSAGIRWEPRDRRWALSAEVSNIFNEDIEIAPGVFGQGTRARIAVERRF